MWGRRSRSPTLKLTVFKTRKRVVHAFREEIIGIFFGEPSLKHPNRVPPLTRLGQLEPVQVHGKQSVRVHGDQKVGHVGWLL